MFIINQKFMGEKEFREITPEKVEEMNESGRAEDKEKVGKFVGKTFRLKRDPSVRIEVVDVLDCDNPDEVEEKSSRYGLSEVRSPGSGFSIRAVLKDKKSGSHFDEAANIVNDFEKTEEWEEIDNGE